MIVQQRNPHFWRNPQMQSIVWFLISNKSFKIQTYMMQPWHPWPFCHIQDGVQDGTQFKQTPKTPLLSNIEQWFWCQTLIVLRVKEFIEMVNYVVKRLIDDKIQDVQITVLIGYFRDNLIFPFLWEYLRMESFQLLSTTMQDPIIYHLLVLY
jgi:hypothetical protein